MRVKHKKYGNGTVLGDKGYICHNDEFYVVFDNSLPILKQSAIAGYLGGHYSEDDMYETREIVKKEDCDFLEMKRLVGELK